MRLRFTIRDLIWLTLVMATNLGWLCYASVEVAHFVVARAQARSERAVVSALEHALEADGWEVEREASEVRIRSTGAGRLARTVEHKFALPE
jgi:hypothetical protein